MKIGILTHPLRTNYGGVLQNYALQYVLKSCGYTVETIDWQENKSIIYIALSYVYRMFTHYVLHKKNVPTDMFLNLTEKQFLYISSNFQTFIKKNIQKSKYIPSKRNIRKVNDFGYDVVIVGSDQVWSNQYVPMMFLDFVKDDDVKRIAYAASFGKDYWTYDKRTTEICSQLAKKFQAISVREDSAISLCENYLHVSAEQVLDPTLLLDKEVYSSLIKETNITGHYLMTYILDTNSYTECIIKKVTESLNLKEFTIRENKETWRISSDNSGLIVKPIENWLKGIRDSDFVVTDSFHGVVFSIIFNKQFLAIGNKRRGLARFQSILKQFNLLDRLVLEDTKIEELLKNLKPIDYNNINWRKKELQVLSLSFLKNNLELNNGKQ